MMRVAQMRDAEQQLEHLVCFGGLVEANRGTKSETRIQLREPCVKSET